MKAVRWEDTKRQIRAANPDWDATERVAERERSREALRAEERGLQLAELRKHTGVTQARLAEAMGVSQARVSQIERGRITGMDMVRAYIEALGWTIEVIANVGGWCVKVA
jgi:DNA-binding XRE family transcriptional regulator